MHLLMRWADRLNNGSIGSDEITLSRTAWLRKWLKVLALAEQVKRERCELSALSAHELKDIGIHEADARVEVQRSFWDLPARRVEQLQKRK
ncbi:MAG: DUF1127 domain-containing protein [Gammaproteobacteria bacterium]|nr:DUF1127 domain-containing protein [Gammaproteobacteria bacterium]